MGMKMFFCKHHNRFMDINYIKKQKDDRCWNCKHFLRVSTRNSKRHNLFHKETNK